MDFLFPLLLRMVVRGSPQNIPSPSPYQWKKGGLIWGFLLLLLSVSLTVYLPSLCLSASPSLCLLTAALSVPLSLSLCSTSVSMPLCLLAKPSHLQTSNTPHLPCLLLFSLSPKPLTPQSPPASLCCIAHCLGRKQSMMFMRRGGGRSRA